MIKSIEEAEEYLLELEAKPFGYGNNRPTASDFQKMKETLRWAVEEIRTIQEGLQEIVTSGILDK